MKCPKCGNELSFREGFSASSLFKIVEVDEKEKDYLEIKLEFVKDINYEKLIFEAFTCTNCDYELELGDCDKEIEIIYPNNRHKYNNIKEV
ncbi:hypothetical protein [Cetobacterium sp.]|uniref:hypothetical protein n=1 Tax=Cetobacterium sp. TaxID=2071632 RepID=UPI003F3B2E2D